MSCARCGHELLGRQRKWCSDNCRKRAFDSDQYRGTCEDCGARTTRRSYHQCDGCRRAEAARGQLERRLVIAAMWGDGLTLPQIAETLETTVNTVGTQIAVMRTEGWELPYRRPQNVIDFCRALGLRDRKAAA